MIAGKRPKTLIRDSLPDRIFNIFNITLMTIIMVVIIYPMYFIVLASFSNPDTVASGQLMFWPKELYLDGYKKIFDYKPLWNGYRNTIFYTILGTVINLAVTIPAAYALSRKNLLGRKWITLLFVFTMFFGGGMVPSYILVKQLHIYNTIWAMLLPGAASVWNIIVCRTFMQTNIPEELHDAALIDGCNEFQFFFRIVLALSKAILAVMALFYAMGHWNNYFGALIYLDNKDLHPLQLVLRDLLVQNQIGFEIGSSITSIAERARLAEQMKYGVIIVSSLPMIAIFPFIQKYFEKGIMIGSLKG